MSHKHHFTISEQVAIRVFLVIAEDLQLLWMDDMVSGEIEILRDWEKQEQVGFKNQVPENRLLSRTVTFKDDHKHEVVIVLKGEDTRWIPKMGEKFGKPRKKFHWNWHPETAHLLEEGLKTAQYIFSSSRVPGYRRIIFNGCTAAEECYMRRTKQPSWRQRPRRKTKLLALLYR